MTSSPEPDRTPPPPAIAWRFLARLGLMALIWLGLNAADFLPILWRSWAGPAAGPWPAEHHFARGETHWMLRLPPLVTAAFVIWSGVFADSLCNSLTWVKATAEREYGPGQS